MRRCAKVLCLDRKTVGRKLVWLARRARKKHADVLKSGDVASSYVQFDEMETFAGNRMRPLSIALAVRAKTGQIIAARVAAMNCHGPLAAKAASLYPNRIDTRDRARTNVLKAVGKIANSRITIATDGNPAYRPVIRTVLPRARHEVHVGGRTKKIQQQQQPPQKKGKKPFDPLFRLNHTCAKIRADLARMARKTWATTKRMWALQYHLDLYIAYNNGYSFG
jgi:hypothetical protein